MIKYSLPGKQISVKNVHDALSCWHDLSGKDGSLLDDLLIIQEKRRESADGKNIVDLRKITNQVLENSIVILGTQDSECAAILRNRFQKNKTIIAVSHEMNLSQDQLNRKQRDAIALLTEILISREKVIRETRSSYQYSRLESSASETIFGNKDLINGVCEKLQDFGDPEIIVITGIGGIGKTTIANAVAKNLIKKFRFDDLIWIRSTLDELWFKNGNFSPDLFAKLLAGKLGVMSKGEEDLKTKVKIELNKKPNLIVIDNLSTEDDIDSLIDFIKGFVNPSKFLITSRRKPSTLNSTFTVNIAELNPETAKELVLDHSGKIGLDRIIDEIEQNMDAIYSLVGGIPLALKLMIGLLDVLPLSVVLNEFKKAQLEDVESMYKYIYWQAWSSLSDPAKSLLVGMVQSSEAGVTLDNMKAWSGISMQEIIQSINELFVRSLMGWRGNIEDRRYGIHELTLTFLQTDIVQWPPE